MRSVSREPGLQLLKHQCFSLALTFTLQFGLSAIARHRNAIGPAPSHFLYALRSPVHWRRPQVQKLVVIMNDNDKHGLHKLSTTTIVIAALGVVFGDIGTSPSYTLKECVSPHSPHHIAATHEHILGFVSLVLWALILLICVKYLVFVLRADNRSEGGVLSLIALATHGMKETAKHRAVIVPLGLFGAAIFMTST